MQQYSKCLWGKIPKEATTQTRITLISKICNRNFAKILPSEMLVECDTHGFLLDNTFTDDKSVCYATMRTQTKESGHVQADQSTQTDKQHSCLCLYTSDQISTTKSEDNVATSHTQTLLCSEY